MFRKLPLNRMSRRAVRAFAMAIAANAVVLPAFQMSTFAADANWTSTSGNLWLTGANWSPASYPGEINNPSSTNSDIATFTSTPVANTNYQAGWGIDFSATGANGNLGTGALVFNLPAGTGGSMGNIGVSLTASTGLLTLNGATVDGVPNTIMKVVSGSPLLGATISTQQTAARLGIQLGNTFSVVNVGSGLKTGGSAAISERTAGSAILKTGTGSWSPSGASTFTGGVTVADGAGVGIQRAHVTNLSAVNSSLGISPDLAQNALGFGTGPLTFLNTSDMAIMYSANSNSANCNNDIVLSSAAVTSEIFVGITSSTTTLRVARFNGQISGGNPNATLLISTAGSLATQTNGHFKLTNAANNFQGTIDMLNGLLTVTNDGALGNANNKILFEQNSNATSGTLIGGLRYDTANVNIAHPVVLQKPIGIAVGTSTTSAFNGCEISGNITNGTDGTGITNIYGGVTTAGTSVGSLRLSGNNTNSASYVVNSPTKLIVGSPTALGDITGTTTVNSGATLGFDLNGTYANAEPVTISGVGVFAASAGVGAIQNVSGTNVFNGPITLAGNSTIGVTAGSLELGGAVSGAVILTKVGSGNLTVKNLAVSGVAINAGNLVLAATPSPITTVTDLNSLAISGTGALDVKNNAVIIRSNDTTSATRNGFWANIISGQNGVDGNGFTNWDGPGIISSTARSNNIGLSISLYAVGIIANHDLDSFYQYNATNGGWLNGAITNVGINDILIRYTYNGDTNLDGSITIADYVAIDSTYGGTATNRGWVSGDFNNDGSIGIEDYVAIDTAYAFQSASLSQSLLNQRLVQFGPAYVAELQSIVSSLSAVPEPTTLGALSLGAMGLLARRRRQA